MEYQEVNGTSYHKDTAPEMVELLENKHAYKEMGELTEEWNYEDFSDTFEIIKQLQ